MSNPELTIGTLREIIASRTDEEILELYQSYVNAGEQGKANILRTECIRTKILSDADWVWTEALEDLVLEESQYLSDFNTSIFCLKGHEPYTIARRNAWLSFSRINFFLTAILEQRKEHPNVWKPVYIFNKEWDLVCRDLNRKQLVMYLGTVLIKDDTYAYHKSLHHYANAYAPEFQSILRAKEMNRDYTDHIESIESKHAELTATLEGTFSEDAEKVMGVFVYLTAYAIEQEDYVSAQKHMAKAIDLLPRGDFLREALMFLQKVLPKE